jgi:hypothetical protein
MHGRNFYPLCPGGKHTSRGSSNLSINIIMKLFRRKGIFFIPASVIGWLLLAIAAVYAVYLFIDIDRRSHSVSDTLINWVFKCLLIGIVYSVIGALTQEKESKEN